MNDFVLSFGYACTAPLAVIHPKVSIEFPAKSTGKNVVFRLLHNCGAIPGTNHTSRFP